MQWSDEATIGYNAAGEYYMNHPLSGLLEANLIGCVHVPESPWNNVIYDLVPGELILNGTTETPPSTIGIVLLS